MRTMASVPVFLVAAMSALAAGCGPVMIGGALGWDAGTLAVGGVATGGGGQLEILAFGPERRLGVGPVAQLAGYSSSGDGDPIAFTTLETRYRGWDPIEGAGFLEVGNGLGVAWSPSVQHVAVPLQVALGLERSFGNFGAELTVRERFIALVGSGSPPAEAFNSVQLAVGLRLGGGR